MALMARHRYGFGQSVDVGLYEGIFRMLDETASVYAKTGEVRERMGPDTVNAVPHSHYETKDGRWVALACSSDKMFERLATVMGQPDLVNEDRFATVAQREAGRSEVNRIVADWMRTMTLDDLMERCISGDVPIGPINSIADIFDDEHIKARGNLVEMEDPREGKVVIPNVVPRLSETPGTIRSLGPDLGQHNDEIFGGLLELPEDEIRRLREQKII
jgi:crotonobetainyl-CoA:carnitine CoA-transferase CaiB-like acyl-CoA transferase